VQPPFVAREPEHAGVQVAVDEAGPVRRRHPRRRLLHDAQGQRQGRRATLGQQRRQRSARPQVRHHELHAQRAVGPEVQHSRHVGVHQPRGGLALLDRRAAIRRGQRAQGDGALQPQVGGAIGGRAAFTGKRLFDAVAVGDDGAGGEGSGAGHPGSTGTG
jgi:hypothetical protein